jgi:hypothetical protein
MCREQRKAMIAPGMLKQVMVDACPLGEVAETSGKGGRFLSK